MNNLLFLLLYSISFLDILLLPKLILYFNECSTNASMQI